MNGIKETCDELGIKFIVYSLFVLGLFIGKYSVENLLLGICGVVYKGVLLLFLMFLEIMREVGDAYGGKMFL